MTEGKRTARSYCKGADAALNSGIEKLPLENDFEEPLRSFMDIAVGLIIDGQPDEGGRTSYFYLFPKQIAKKHIVFITGVPKILRVRLFAP